VVYTCNPSTQEVKADQGRFFLEMHCWFNILKTNHCNSHINRMKDSLGSAACCLGILGAVWPLGTLGGHRSWLVWRMECAGECSVNSRGKDIRAWVSVQVTLVTFQVKRPESGAAILGPLDHSTTRIPFLLPNLCSHGCAYLEWPPCPVSPLQIVPNSNPTPIAFPYP
jgi:hypothetical protein